MLETSTTTQWFYYTQKNIARLAHSRKCGKKYHELVEEVQKLAEKKSFFDVLTDNGFSVDAVDGGTVFMTSDSSDFPDALAKLTELHFKYYPPDSGASFIVSRQYKGHKGVSITFVEPK